MSERRFTMRLESGKAVLDPRYMAGSTADIVEHLAKLEENVEELECRAPDEVNSLKSENASLRERLERSVELPKPKIEPNFYGFVLTWFTVEEHKRLFESEKEAESRLAELKGEKEE